MNGMNGMNETGHILLVEDDMKVRMALSRRLQYAGYHVTEAADGETAIRLLHEHAFHVVLTDIMLGMVDGIEVLQAARHQPYRPAVILLTGHGALDTSIAALRKGAHDYLLKPCTDDEMLESVQQAMQRHLAEKRLLETASLLNNLYGTASGDVPLPAELPHPAAAPAAPPPEKPAHSNENGFFLRIGGLRIGSARNQVSLNEQPLHVTPIEYALLRCLAETPGEVQSYEAIISRTHNYAVSENEAQQLLKPHIRNLRSKLDAAYLVNYRGIGYMLVDPTGEKARAVGEHL
jgi:DNA-binding response OmpR family regulator